MMLLKSDQGKLVFWADILQTLQGQFLGFHVLIAFKKASAFSSF